MTHIGFKKRIDYALRDKRYSGTEYDLQRLVGKRFLGLQYALASNDKRRYKDIPSYDVSLKWEGFIMKFVAVDEGDIPIVMKEFTNFTLEDWDIFPNHAAQMVILHLKDFEEVIVFNTYGGIYGGIEWQTID
ncbi:MAG: hypothetical protein FWE68_06870 [Defluviitaleaceae bacterium]|nr:hypothetical protein [Defluviitaleaceae bacterium]